MTFTAWLMQQTHRDDPIGDLASDTKADRKWPSEAYTLKDFENHLHAVTASLEALDALRAAWREWLRMNFKKTVTTKSPGLKPKPSRRS